MAQVVKGNRLQGFLLAGQGALENTSASLSLASRNFRVPAL